jgi:hypothetical protein
MAKKFTMVLIGGTQQRAEIDRGPFFSVGVFLFASIC